MNYKINKWTNVQISNQWSTHKYKIETPSLSIDKNNKEEVNNE